MTKLSSMTLAQIEAALSAGQIFALMTRGNAWKARRNGATKLWKTRPGEFQIPVKAGLKACGYIRHDNLDNFELR